MKPRPKSKIQYEKLCEVIPGGVNSPIRAFKGVGQLPLVVESGFQEWVRDVDGNQYIDYCGSWGALIHGHAHPKILKAAAEQMQSGTTFGITTAIEEALARKIIELVPSIETIRFVSTGTEATMSAARLARGYTGKDIIVKFDGNFHGHADFFLVRAGSGVLDLNPTSSSSGIPEHFIQSTVSLPYNDEKACQEYLYANGSKIAGVILEPISGNMGVVPATQSFIKMLRKATQEIEALLIFDEVITGFRVAKGGAQELYSIKPDLTCFAKIIGGGFPAAAFGGRREIMEFLAPLGDVYQAGTLSGNPVAMRAGYEALELLDKPGFYEELKSKTDILTQPIIEYLQNHPQVSLCLQQEGSMFTLFFGRRSVSNMAEAQQCNSQLFGEFFRHLFDRGIYIPPLQWEAWFVSASHSIENLERTRDCILDFLDYKNSSLT